MAVSFRLYSRTGCHLCDEMLQELEVLQRTSAGAFTVDILDIDRDVETQRRYSLRIPVLTAKASGEVVCETRFNKQSFLAYLTGTAR